MKIINNSLRILTTLIILAVVLIYPVGALAQIGKYDLNLWLVPGEYPNKVKPGQENRLFLNVQNNSNFTVTGVRFSSDAPDGWNINFNPPSLDSLTSGSTYTLDVTIIPPQTVEKGDYPVSLIATANETRAVTTTSLRVEGASYWLWIGFGIAGLIIIAFIVIYWHFGRK